MLEEYMNTNTDNDRIIVAGGASNVTIDTH